MNKLNELEVPEVVGLSEVARWLGTTTRAAGNWMHRYADLPRPYCKQAMPQGSHYLWLATSRQEWLQWASTKDVWALMAS